MAEADLPGAPDAGNRVDRVLEPRVRVRVQLGLDPEVAEVFDAVDLLVFVAGGEMGVLFVPDADPGLEAALQEERVDPGRVLRLVVHHERREVVVVLARAGDELLRARLVHARPEDRDPVPGHVVGRSSGGAVVARVGGQEVHGDALPVEPEGERALRQSGHGGVGGIFLRLGADLKPLCGEFYLLVGTPPDHQGEVVRRVDGFHWSGILLFRVHLRKTETNLLAGFDFTLPKRPGSENELCQ